MLRGSTRRSEDSIARRTWMPALHQHHVLPIISVTGTKAAAAACQPGPPDSGTHRCCVSAGRRGGAQAQGPPAGDHRLSHGGHFHRLGAQPFRGACPAGRHRTAPGSINIPPPPPAPGSGAALHPWTVLSHVVQRMAARRSQGFEGAHVLSCHGLGSAQNQQRADWYPTPRLSSCWGRTQTMMQCREWQGGEC